MTATTNVFVPLAGGVKSAHSDRLQGAKSSSLLSIGDGVIQLANGIVDRFWQVIKRPGGVALPVSVSTGGSLPPPWRLTSRGDQLVALASYGQASPAYALSPGAAKWIPAIAQQHGPVKFTRTRVAAGAALESPDFAYLTGYYATAHLNRLGSPVFSLIDETNNQVIFTDTRGGATEKSTHVKVVACNGTFSMFFTAIANGLKVVTYDPTTFTATPHTLSATVPSTTRANLDAIKISGTVIKAVYQNGADTQLVYADYTPSSGAVSTGELTDSGTGHLKQDAMCWVRDLANTGRVSLVTVGGDSSATGAKGVAMAGGGAKLHSSITGGQPASSLAIDGGQIVASHAPVMRVTAMSRSATVQDVLTLVELGATANPIPNVDPVDFATTAVLNDHAFNDPDYQPGSTPPATAVGATLTALGNGTLSVDGSSPTAGQRILVKNQTGDNKVTNGIYIVSDAGSAGTVWKLTRATDFDSANELGVDVTVKVTGGSTLAGAFFTHYGAPSQMNTTQIGSSFLTNKPDGTPIVFASNAPASGNDRAHRYVLACSSASGSATQASWMLGLGLSSVPFSMNGRFFVLGDYDNTPYSGQTQPLQSSFFLIELPAGGQLPATATPAVSQANIAVGNGGGSLPDANFGTIALSNVPSVFANAAGELVIPIKVRSGGTAGGDARGIEICRISNASGLALGNLATFGDSLVLPGAVLSVYDGTALQGLGFPIFPEAPLVAAGAVGNDAVPITWRWAIVYRWSDAQGRIYRSRPSAPADVKAPPGTPSATITATSYRLGDKMVPGSPSPTSAVAIELYRSQANIPELLYYVTEVPNDPTVQTVSISDTSPDSVIATNELLYTSGGVLSNDPPPGASEVCYHGGRLFVVSMDDPTLVAYSQPNNGFDGPGLPNALTIQRPTPVAGLASFAENLILFEGGGVFRISPSTGPDAQGRGLFPDARTIEPGTTTGMPLSICVSSDGVFFRTLDPLDGIQMVNGAMQVIPKGLDVQKYTQDVVASAYFPKQCQARFWTAFDPTLVYDATHELWSTFTGQGASAATIWNGVPVYAPHSGGALIMEQAGIYTENGALYDLDIFSPWFSPQGSDKAATVPNVGGYFLLRDMLGVGTGQGGPTLVELRKDFDPATVIASYTGTPGPLWDWVVKGAWKLGCFQVRIRERSATAGPVINGFTVDVAPKRGMNRRPSGNTLPNT